MNENILQELMFEIREEFHIPPFFPDERIKTLINESNFFLLTLVNVINYDVDLFARTLLKNRVFYGYNNRTSLFQEDYAQDLLSWQFSRIGDDIDE